jgi:PPOX class probable F420-dependent enzyme
MVFTPDENSFIREHRLAVVSTVKKDGGPQATPVYYVYDGKKLFISVTAARKKTVNVRRDPRVAVTVLAEEHPFKHVQVTGRAEITDDNLVDMSHRIWSTFREPPKDFAKLLADQGRVLMVVTPERATSNLTPSR